MNKDKVKTEFIGFKCSKELKDELLKKAKELDLTLSTYIILKLRGMI